ncbi:MAG: hypothetical protein M0017_04375 [Desulfobacteraceae bacterium]|nr:hypothetical protein [Desulfobacteraceae bacterium]
MKKQVWRGSAVLSVLLAMIVCSPAPAAETGGLRELNRPGEPYHTPLAGEGFRGVAFGREVVVAPEDRRSVNAWTVGAQVNLDEPDERLVIPFGSVYLWRHPDDHTLFRAELAGLYDDVLYARSPSGWGPFELVLSFQNYTLPLDRSEVVDGEKLQDEQLTWGYVRPGFGLGYRRQTWPGNEDNMFALDFLVEPSYSYYSKGSDAAAGFVPPQDTSELRGVLQLRWDSLVRNILSLPHRGVALRADAVYGHRHDWGRWGLPPELEETGGRDYRYVTGYLLGAGGVPFVKSERHRLLGAFYGGAGSNLDRFTAPRVGGGPEPLGEEFGSTAMPVLPGAAIHEFFPDHYAILIGEYRWEPIFFTYFHVRAAVARLDRLRRNDTGGIYHSTDDFAALGMGITTGFFFKLRLCLDYSYNTGVIRDHDHGGNEVVLRVSRPF